MKLNNKLLFTIFCDFSWLLVFVTIRKEKVKNVYFSFCIQHIPVFFKKAYSSCGSLPATVCTYTWAYRFIFILNNTLLIYNYVTIVFTIYCEIWALLWFDKNHGWSEGFLCSYSHIQCKQWDVKVSWMFCSRKKVCQQFLVDFIIILRTVVPRALIKISLCSVSCS